MNESSILGLIPPSKDVDGLHPFNIGNLAMKNHQPFFYSCTPLACQELILSSYAGLHGKDVTLQN